MEKILFETEDGDKQEFFVEEETRVGGVGYLLVTDSDGEEANAYIMKDLSEDGEAEARYVMVEDDVEYEAVARIFEQMMDDVSFE